MTELPPANLQSKQERHTSLVENGIIKRQDQAGSSILPPKGGALFPPFARDERVPRV